MTDDAAWTLAQHVCRTSYADLPASAIRSSRRDILDTFGCMLGGSGSPGIEEFCRVIGRWGGLEESRVLLRAARPVTGSARLGNYSAGRSSTATQGALTVPSCQLHDLAAPLVAI
jgi:2-methylcitrate dehydratase PrpD